MRTAKEIAADVFNQWAFSGNEREAMVKVINQARKEAIEECAEKATVHHDKYAMINGKKNVSMCEVNKQSILNLINELK